MSSHIGARVGFPLYRRSHFGEFRRPDVAPEESSLARILLEVHGFEHTIPGVHVEKKEKKRRKKRAFFFANGHVSIVGMICITQHDVGLPTAHSSGVREDRKTADSSKGSELSAGESVREGQGGEQAWIGVLNRPPPTPVPPTEPPQHME